MSNPQGEAAATQATANANLASMLSGQALPMFAQMFGATEQQLAGGPDNIMPFIKTAFDRARTEHNVSYEQAGRTGAEMTRYRALTSDNPFSQGEQTSAIGQLGYGLEQERQQGLKTLGFQEAQTNLQTYTALLNTLGAGTNSALSLGAGMNSAAMAGISALPKSGTGENILGGVLSGAATGAATGNPYGVLAGAVLGGVLGGVRGG